MRQHNWLRVQHPDGSMSESYDVSAPIIWASRKGLRVPVATTRARSSDRYYTTYRLIAYLTDKRTYFSGTLNTNCKTFPPQLKTLKLNHHESRLYRDNKSGILCVAWRDKKAEKPCILVSTKAIVQDMTITWKRGNEVTLPSLIHDYNQSMNGCDRVDQSVSYYGQFTRKTIKWWKRIFFWLMEICQVNLYAARVRSVAALTLTSHISTWKSAL